MRRFLLIVSALCVLLVFTPVAQANPWSFEIFEVAFNQNGSLWDWPYSDPWGSMPSNVNKAGFDSSTGLGILQVRINTIGSVDFAVLFDHEIKDTSGVAFYANNGEPIGTPGAGVSWEIDEPEIGGWNYKGDIFTNLVNVTLDNQSFFNGVDTWTDPEDAAMALAWTLNIPVQHHAIVTLTVTDTDPGSGFRLHQWATNADKETAHLYLKGSAAIYEDQGGPIIPEPWQAPLVAAALVALGVVRSAKRGKQ